MRWSKLKARVEACFAPALGRRVELRATRYHGAPDQLGRGYITVDGKEVWNMCSFQFGEKEYRKIESISGKSQKPRREVWAQAHQVLQGEGVLAQWHFYRALVQYCNEPIETSLSSQNVLTRALSMLDSRVGKRRLSSLDLSLEHSMVKYFHALRCEVERLHA